MYKKVYVMVSLVLFFLSACEDGEDKCRFIEITKNSDFEKYSECTYADQVSIFGETTQVDGLNNLIEIKNGIKFDEPDISDEAPNEIDAPIQSITGFKKLKKFGYFDFSGGDEIVLSTFDTFHEVTDIQYFLFECDETTSSDCNLGNLKDLNAFEKLEHAPEGLFIVGKNIESIPDFKKVIYLHNLYLGLPKIKKIPTFDSLKKIHENISVNFSCNFTESEIKAEFSGIISENYGNDYLQIYDRCD